MSKNKYKRHSRGGRFQQQGQNIFTEVDKIRQQRQIEIDAIKQQALQQQEINKQQISGMSNVARVEAENRQTLQDLENKIYNNKRRAIDLRGRREVENLEGQAKELGLQSEFWQDFATTHSKNLGQLAGSVTNYAQYRAAMHAYAKLDPSQKKDLEDTYKNIYGVVEKQGHDNALQISHTHNIPTQEDLNLAKLSIEKTAGGFANNRHFWRLIVADIKANKDYHMNFVRTNSLDKDGNNMYNSKQAPQLLMNHISILAYENGIPLGSAEYNELVSLMKQAIPAEVKRLKQQEQYQADDIKRTNYIKSTDGWLEDYRSGKISEEEWNNWIEAMHWFSNGSTQKFTEGGKTVYADLSSRTDLTKKDRLGLTLNWLSENVDFLDYTEARERLNIPVRDNTGKIVLNKKGEPAERVLDKHKQLDNLVKETITNKTKKKREENTLILAGERMRIVEGIEKEILDDWKKNKNYDATLWNEDWLKQKFSKIDSHSFNQTAEQARFYDLVGFPTRNQISSDDFAKLRSEFRSGDINGALNTIYKLKKIPANFVGIHESIDAIKDLKFEDFNKTLTDAIKEEFKANIKGKPAKLAKFYNSNDLALMTDIAAARFMDLFLDNSHITDAGQRYRETFKQLENEIQLGMTLKGGEPGTGLFALTKERGSAYGFSFVALGGGDGSLTLDNKNGKEIVKNMFMSSNNELEGYEFHVPFLKPYEEGLLESTITQNFETIFPDSNDVRNLMISFLKGTSNYGNLGNNLQRFLTETEKLYPNVSKKEIMDTILNVITNGKAEIDGNPITGYEAYKNTAWPPSTKDLTKMLVGKSTGDDNKDRILILDKLLKNNGINVNAMGGR